DAEQPKGKHFACQALLEDRLGRLPEKVGRVAGFGECLRAVSSLEIGGANLEFDGSRAQAGMAQSGRQLICEVEQPIAEELSIADVFWESGFRADRLGFAIRDDLAIVVAGGQFAEVFSQVAKLSDEILFREASELADGFDAQRMQPLLGFLADAP